jgi:hypothetical protein
MSLQTHVVKIHVTKMWGLDMRVTGIVTIRVATYAGSANACS